MDLYSVQLVVVASGCVVVVGIGVASDGSDVGSGSLMVGSVTNTGTKKLE